MGCWNGTCGVTQIALTAGDPVRFILLQEQPSRSDPGGFCYHIGDWAPRCIPIKGEYDDYGGVENIETNGIHDFEFNRLKAVWVEPPPDHHNATKEGFAADLTWDGIIHNVERDLGRIKTGGLHRSLAAITKQRDLDEPDPFAKPRDEEEKRILEAISTAKWTKGFSQEALKAVAAERVSNNETRRKLERLEDYVRYLDGVKPQDVIRIGMVIVHEDVYQAMVTMVRNRKTWWLREEDQTIGENIRRVITNAIEAHSKLAALEEERKKAKESGDDEAEVKFLSQEIRTRDKIFQAGRELSGGEVRVGIDYTVLLEHIAQQEDPEPLIDELVEFCLFDAAMGTMRKHYAPQGGKGSQNDEHDLYLAVGETMAAILKKRKAEYEEYED
jgi:hypothetical protein